MKQGQKNDPYAYLKPATMGQLRKETRAATNMAYRPTENQIRSNKRASAERTKNIGSWWNQYLAEVSGQQAASQQAYANAAQQTQGLINTGSQVDTANTAKLNADASAAAAMRGQSADQANTANTQTANMALSQRNTLLGAMGSATAARGANQFSYLGDKRRIGKGQRAASMEAEAKRGASMLGDLASLRKERGDFSVKYLGDKMERAQDRQIQRAAFNLDKKEGAADRELDWFNANTARKNSERGEGGGAPGGRTPTQIRNDRRDYKNALTTARSLYQAADNPPSTDKEWAQWVVLVAQETGVDSQVVRKAVNRLRAKLRKEGKRASPVVEKVKEVTPGF